MPRNSKRQMLLVILATSVAACVPRAPEATVVGTSDQAAAVVEAAPGAALPASAARPAAPGTTGGGSRAEAVPGTCAGSPVRLVYGSNVAGQDAFRLSDGSLATWARMAVNVDGMARAYHRDDVAGGGLIALCNGGRPYPAGQADYNASASNEACGRFRSDYARIRAAGWKDPSIGAIHWFGVLGTGGATIPGPRGPRQVSQVQPVEQSDGSGYYVSPTALQDAQNHPRKEDQRRYVDAERVPAAVIRDTQQMRQLGITMGTYGVAIHRTTRRAFPFIVGDAGPRIGEGSFALGRAVKGLPEATATRANIYSGHVEGQDVLWIFFGGERALPPYTPERVKAHAAAAFDAWGGAARLDSCINEPSIPRANR